MGEARSAVEAMQGGLTATVEALVGAMETLAALGARLRVDGNEATMDPAVARAIEGVLAAAGIAPESLAALAPERRASLAGAIGALVRQADNLVAHPERPPGWASDDPVVLEGFGHMSAPIAGAIADAARSLHGLSARLAAEDAALLDVGTGVGRLAIALARTFPRATVVGIDLFEPALDRARHHVVASGLGGRVVVRAEDAARLSEEAAYDAAFLASPFFPRDSAAACLPRLLHALRPGGWLLFGLFATVDEERARAAQALRVVRSGGHAWADDEARGALAQAGFGEVCVVERAWPAPVRFIAGRRSHAG